MCKHDLDLLPLEFMCNLATLYLPYAHVPDTLSAISTTQLMVWNHILNVMFLFFVCFLCPQKQGEITPDVMETA